MKHLTHTLALSGAVLGFSFAFNGSFATIGADYIMRLGIQSNGYQHSIKDQLVLLRSKKYLLVYQEQARNLVVNFFIVWQFIIKSLDKQHKLLGRLTEIGTELFVISACALRIDSMIKDEPEKKAEYLELMDVVFNESKIRIKNNFYGMRNNNDKKNYSFQRKFWGTFSFLSNYLLTFLKVYDNILMYIKELEKYVIEPYFYIGEEDWVKVKENLKEKMYKKLLPKFL